MVQLSLADVMIYLCCNILSTYLLYRFNCAFLPQTKPFNTIGLGLYALYFLVTSATFLLWQNPPINIAGNLITIFLIILWYPMHGIKRVLYTAFVYAIALSCEMLVVYMLGWTLDKKFTADIQFVMSIILSRLLFYLAIIFLEKRRELGAPSKLSKSYWAGLLIISAGNITLSLLLMGSELSYSLTVVSASIITIFTFTMFYLYEKILAVSRKETEHLLLESKIAFYQMQNDTFEKNQKNLMSLKHDMKNHMIYILNCAKRGENEEIISYSENMLGNLKTAQWNIDTQNPAIDAMLNRKLAEAKEQSVEVATELNLTPRLPIAPNDMSIVLGNLLDNAIEACAPVAPEKRRLQVALNSEHNALSIRIENSYCPALLKKEENGSYSSTKKESEGHGLGLKNVQEVINRYNGYYETKQVENNFCCWVTIFTHMR